MNSVSIVINLISLFIGARARECLTGGPSLKVELLSEPVEHGEGPHWDDFNKLLYYVDIAGFKVCRFDPKTHSTTYIKLNDTVSFVVPIKDETSTFVIGLGRHICKLVWNDSNYSLATLTIVDSDKPKNRLNDAKAGPGGELWFGTMGEEKNGTVKLDQGSLFRMKNGLTTTVVSPVSISNGLAWSKDNKTMFYIDTPTRRIDAFDYDVVTGDCTNRRTFFDFALHNVTGFPDGMTIDEEDNLWVAVWGGSHVLQISSSGCLKRAIAIPTERVTSVEFGGESFQDLFVTTMKNGDDPKGGALFIVRKIPEKGMVSRNVVVPGG